MQLQPKSFFKKTEYTFEKLLSDKNRIELFYRSRGYLSSFVTILQIEEDTVESTVSISLLINEGQRSYIESFVTSGNQVLTESAINELVGFQVGEPLDSQIIVRAQNTIIEALGLRGHLYAKVGIEFDFGQSNLQVTVLYTIQEGPAVKALKIEFVGLYRLKEETIVRELNFKIGKLLTSSDIRSSIQALYQTALVELITIEPLYTDSIFSEDTVCVPVLIQVDEADFFAIQAGGGYDSYEKLYGIAKVAYRNLFGLGHEIIATGRLSSVTKGFYFEYTYPYILNRPSLGELSFYLEHRDLETIQGLFEGGSASVTVHLNNSTAIQLSTELEYFASQRTTEELSLQPNRNTILFGTKFTRDTRDSYIDPKNANYLNTLIELAGPAIKWSNQFLRLSVDFRFYRSFFINRLVLSSAIYAGHIAATGKNKFVPSSEFFRIGIEQVRPVRGFTENEVSPLDSNGDPTGGKIVLVTNIIDLRFKIYRFLYGELFVDAGSSWNSFADIQINNLRFSSGPGLILNLPTGLFRLNYGFKLNGATATMGGWNFGIGLPF
jgi:outer membrane protein assembly complex protein YaeT